MTDYYKPFLTYALNRQNNLVYIDDVEGGEKCECRCPYCSGVLLARKGDVRKHHFSHKSGKECSKAYESAIHLMAKEELKKSLTLQPPKSNGLFNINKLVFDKVDCELFDKETGLRPDCICHYGNKELWIEFCYRHAIDEKKRETIFLAKKDCIEINLKNCKLDRKAVSEFITSSLDDREWIYNSDFPFFYDVTNSIRNIDNTHALSKPINVVTEEYTTNKYVLCSEPVFIKFSLFSDGSYYTDKISESEKTTPRKDAIFEVIFEAGIKDNYGAEHLALEMCLNKKHSACYCPLCKNLSSFRKLNEERFCNRYNDCGILYPMKEKPINCHGFQHNDEFIQRLKNDYPEIVVSDYSYRPNLDDGYFFCYIE